MQTYTRMRETIKMDFLLKIFGKHRLINIATKEKTVNVLVMGKAAVGKTSLIRKLVGHETFTDEHIPTIYDDIVKEMNVDEYKTSFKFMELGGTQSFPTMQETFIQQAEMYMLVYAANDAESYNYVLELRDKLTQVKKRGYSELPIIVVRNKVDTRRRRSRQDKMLRKQVANWCVLSHDVSSKTGLRVNSIMDTLIEESKFIGNEGENNFHISGRYIYNEKSGQSELYHKAPGLFNSHDNSDEKMKERRMKLQNRLNRKQLSTSMPSLKRSLSLTSLRHSMRRLRRKRKSFQSEEMSDSCASLKQSTKSLNVPHSSTLPERQMLKDKNFDNRSSTLPERQVLKDKNLNSRSSTLPEKGGGRDSYVSVDINPDMDIEDSVGTSSLNDRVVVRREKSKSMYIPRTCNSLVVPNSTSSTATYGSCLTIESQSKVSEKASESSFHVSERMNKGRSKGSVRPKLSRQYSTDQYDVSSGDNNTHPVLQRTVGIPMGSNRASLESNSDNNERMKRNSTDLLDGYVRNSLTETVDINQQNQYQTNSSTATAGATSTNIQKSSPDSITRDSQPDTLTISRQTNSSFRTNSPQILRSVPVMRRQSLSQNAINDMFTVTISEPKRKQSIFRLPNRKNSPTNSSPKHKKSISVERERKYSDSSSNSSVTVNSSNTASRNTSPVKTINEENLFKRSFGSRHQISNSSTQNSTQNSMKLPLTRVRSKSSSELRDSADINRKSSGSFTSQHSYDAAKRASWNCRAKPQLKSILKNSSGDATPFPSTISSLKIPLSKMDSLSHDDIRKERSKRFSQVSNDRTTSIRTNESNRPNVRTKKKSIVPVWTQSVSFNKSIDENLI